jgi:murein DD-endopeptidase MepM/ murein hydrolase activator NlpD
VKIYAEVFCLKNNNKMKSGTKKQIMNGLAYLALSVTVVAVTIGSIVNSFSENNEDITKNNIESSDKVNDYTLKLPDSPLDIGDFILNTPVSDSPSGISAEISAPDNSHGTTVSIPSLTPEPSEKESEKQPSEADSNSTPDKTKSVSEEPDEAVFEYGFNGFIKPCQGYISKEFSDDVPVYSVSMYDYRTHNGVDIVGEIGTPVKASSNGVITEVYNDYLYGTTVVIEHKDGIKSVYSNLSPNLPADTVSGRAVITGEIIAGIGESAACEYAEANHLHFELLKDGNPVNPEEYFVN